MTPPALLTPAPVDVFFGAVPVFTLLFSKENMPVLITGLVTIIAALIAASVGWKKHQVEKSAGVVASFEKLLEAERVARKQDKEDWDKKFAAQGEQIKELTREVKELKFVEATNRHTIRALEDETHDLREERDDLRAYVIDVARHRARDYGPPPPEPSWRIERLLAKAREEGLL